MFGFMNKVKTFVTENVSEITTKVKQELNEFMEENKKLEASAKIEETRALEAKLPWEVVKIGNNSSEELRETIKEEILDLSNHEDNFLAEDSTYMFEFDFNMEECKYQAIKIMEYDEKLGLLRNQLVPHKTSEEKFWKNYFYNVELIKMKHAIKAEEEAEAEEEEQEEREEEEDIPATKSQEKKEESKPEEEEDEEEEEEDVPSPAKKASEEKEEEGEEQAEEEIAVKKEASEEQANEGESAENPDFDIKLGEPEKEDETSA